MVVLWNMNFKKCCVYFLCIIFFKWARILNSKIIWGESSRGWRLRWIILFFQKKFKKCCGHIYIFVLLHIPLNIFLTFYISFWKTFLQQKKGHWPKKWDETIAVRRRKKYLNTSRLIIFCGFWRTRNIHIKKKIYGCVKKWNLQFMNIPMYCGHLL